MGPRVKKLGNIQKKHIPVPKWFQCFQCDKKTKGNPRFILKTASCLGYDDKNFCSLVCFIEYVKKRWSKRIW